MLSLSSSQVKNFSRLGQRAAYGQSLLRLADIHSDIFCLSADLGNSSGLDRFISRYPSRYLNVGIAEQNLIGVSAGLSSVGFNCFASSFAPFITMRCCEQIRMNLGYMRENVKIVSLGSGISMGYLGNSHFGLEDISIILAQNDIPIFCPSDTTMLDSIICFLSTHTGPAYLRLTGAASSGSLIYQSSIDVTIGGSVTLHNGSDILILSHGFVTSTCFEVVKNFLLADNISCHLEDVYCVHPIGSQILELLSRFDKVVVLEEHRQYGGLYTQICEVIARENLSIALIPITLPNSFLVSGSYIELLSYYHLDYTGIWNKIQGFYSL